MSAPTPSGTAHQKANGPLDDYEAVGRIVYAARLTRRLALVVARRAAHQLSLIY
jgi:hypothetical protein